MTNDPYKKLAVAVAEKLTKAELQAYAEMVLIDEWQNDAEAFDEAWQEIFGDEKYIIIPPEGA